MIHKITVILSYYAPTIFGIYFVRCMIIGIFAKKQSLMITAPIYSTNFGASYLGNSLYLIEELDDDSVDLVITSPPFALLRKKEYGNEDQNEYVEWLSQFCS